MLESYYGKRGDAGKYSVFRSKGFSPEWTISGLDQRDVSMQSLPPFLRTLLVTDGTVTKSLEAFYWESVRIHGVSQNVTSAASAIDWLEVKAGDPVLARYVQLRGVRSDLTYANAFSVSRLQLIPADLRAKLLDGSLGIGELIRNCGLETYRELMEIGMTDDLGNEDGEVGEECVYRTYRIILNHRPAILVTESFPVRLFRG